MMLVLHRNYTLRTRAGISIAFVKGKPTHVPRKVLKDAMAIGAVPADPNEQVQMDEVARIDRSKSRDEAIDPELREKRIIEMLTFMRERSLREYFTASGSPSIKHLSLLCGFEVDKTERDKHWRVVLGLTQEEETQPGDTTRAL